MNGEILSIETAQKIARLEKENKELSEIVIKFDREVNRLFNIIKDAYEYVDKRLLYTPVSIAISPFLGLCHLITEFGIRSKLCQSTYP